jgi:type II secretory pathway pseudopilin PulG
MKTRRQEGFTLVEALIVFVIIAIIGGMAFPAARRQIWRAKLLSRSEEMGIHMLLARMEAMKHGFPVVVIPDYVSQTLTAFVDEDDDQVQDPLERQVFALGAGTSGHERIHFMGPNGVPGTAADPAESVVDFTPVPGGNLKAAVFEPDGSIRDTGAFRFADDRGDPRNTLEVRVSPRSTARIEVRKYVYGGGCTGTDLPACFYPAGAGLWQWYL